MRSSLVKITLCIVGLGGMLVLPNCSSNEELDTALSQLPDKIDFNYHVKPILSDKCFMCHGPDNNARQADLRLDTEEGALRQKLSSGGRAFVAGSLRKSEAFQRILSDDPEHVMPTPETNLKVTQREKAILAKWIKQGATYKEHWSFILPEQAVLPKLQQANWPKNEIDHFIGQKMEQVGLSASEEARKETLIRRLSFDLRGLPPTPEEVEQFLANTSPNAYEKVVDQFLASPHFGERIAVEWLDVARYADSHGYQDDGMRNTWPYRDWVIQAFNENLPYDKFVTWQLAGDLLPNPTKEQLIATCFNRNHPQTQEGGVVDEEYRVEYVADRTNTLGKAFLGLTMRCARCHDHKYDPISQKDYYSLYAFFNNNNDTGIVPYNGEAAPTLTLPSEEAAQKLSKLKKQIDTLSSELLPESYLSDFQNWYQQLENGALPRQAYGLIADFSFEKESKINVNSIYLDKPPTPKRKPRPGAHVFTFFNTAKGKLDAQNWGHKDDRPQLVDGYKGKGVQFMGDGGIRFNRDLDFDRNQSFSVSLWVKLLKEGEAGPIFNKTNGDFEGYRGWLCKLNEDGTLSVQFNHVWPDDCIDYQTKATLPVNEWTQLTLTYDGSSKASGIRFYWNGQAAEMLLHTDKLQKSLLHGVKGSNWSNLPFLLGMELRQSIENIVMDELKIYDRELSDIEVKALYTGTTLNAEQLLAAKEDAISYYLLSGNNQRFNERLAQITSLRQEVNVLFTDQPAIMIMQERKHPKPTFILDRGAYDAPTTEVQVNTPAKLPAFPEDYPQNRLGLARWLVDGNNPLTARVAVNRFWMICFGKGLVATQEDFGNQGDLPTHPELMDWLAVYFVESGWDVKALLKKIVTSATYRQSSLPGEIAKSNDPENLWYSHYSAHRLTAEQIRDNALAASGLLVRKVGGPSVYPYQPKGIWKALATRNATEYRQQSGDSLYRRSLYTIWKRSSPPPSMMNFDAPDRYFCVVRRQKTATPLQSLVLLNDPQFVESARMLATHLMKQEGLSLEDRIHQAFLNLTSRKATPKEVQLLTQLYQEELKEFEQAPDRAKEWLQVGETPPDPALAPTALAAHTVLTSTIMNFDEFIIKR